VYRLSSMVCYYGAHYQALVRRPDTGAWQLLDDANVSHIGSWVQVRVKCQRGRIQPAVLFFEKYEGAFPWQQPSMDSPFQAPTADLVSEEWQSRGPQRVASAEVESFQQHVLVEPFSVLSLAASAPEPLLPNQPMPGVLSDGMLTHQRWSAVTMGPPPSFTRSQSLAPSESIPGYGDGGRYRSDQLNGRPSEHPNGMPPYEGAQWMLSPNMANQGVPPPTFVHNGNPAEFTGAPQQWQQDPSHFAAFPVPGQQPPLSNAWAALPSEIHRNLLPLTQQQQQQQQQQREGPSSAENLRLRPPPGLGQGSGFPSLSRGQEYQQQAPRWDVSRQPPYTGPSASDGNSDAGPYVQRVTQPPRWSDAQSKAGT